MIQRILLLSVLALISLTSIQSSWATTVDEQRDILLDAKKQAEAKGDTNAAAAIDSAIDQLKDYADNQNKPALEVLADPEHNHFAYVVRGALVKPETLTPEMAELVPPAPHPAWSQVSFSTIAEALEGKIALLHPHVTHNGNSPIQLWVIDQKEIDAVIKPQDPDATPRIGVYVFPQDNQPMSGVMPIKDKSAQ